MNPLAVEHVYKQFGGLTILDDVNLVVHSGERRALLGPNGAGKTTLFHVISGLIPASRGKILFFDQDVTNLSVHRRAHLGLGRTFQITSLFFYLTVEENMLLALKAGEASINPFSLKTIRSFKHLMFEAEGLLRQADLWENRQVQTRNLSYGEQRKLEVGLALAQKPKVLLLDEPTCGLAPEERTIMTTMLKALPRDVALLVIEHDLDVAFELAERVTILSAGRVLAEGPLEEIRSNAEVQRAYLGVSHV